MRALRDPDAFLPTDLGVRHALEQLGEDGGPAAAERLAERTGFVLALVMDGTPFQRRVWRALQDLPYGETISYGELARRIDQPAAPRAVGLANGRNPISVIVPCHRVIGADGTLTGYGGGTERKRLLLDLEQDAGTRKST